MRMALGADRSHIATHFLAEGLVLSLSAAALGVALAWAGLHALIAGAPDGIPRLAEVRLGWPSIGIAAVLAFVTGACFALIPIVNARVDVRTLREGSRTLTTSRRRNAVRGVLVAGQVALALVLLAAAGLMVRSFRNLRAVQPGFDPNGVLTMAVALPAARYANDQTASAFFEQLATQLKQLPDVKSVGFGDQIPPRDDHWVHGRRHRGAVARGNEERVHRHAARRARLLRRARHPRRGRGAHVGADGQRRGSGRDLARAGRAILARRESDREGDPLLPTGQGLVPDRRRERRRAR